MEGRSARVILVTGGTFSLKAKREPPLHLRVDDLSDPAAPGTPYAGVWADASLLHVDRDELPRVLSRLADATATGGALFLGVKEGDGEDWSLHGNVTAPRFFTYWREEPLRSALGGAGWQVTSVERDESDRGEHWLLVTAHRA